MNPIIEVLAIALIAAGATLAAMGQFYFGIAVAVAAVVIASLPQKANGPLPAINRSQLRKNYRMARAGRNRTLVSLLKLNFPAREGFL